jgi:hypothetical protein
MEDQAMARTVVAVLGLRTILVKHTEQQTLAAVENRPPGLVELRADTV